ncbi:unnamed protein product (macronuclear) [Paramecium tetraurelia]|uniref:Uncharacterized protein n=1 Tax=Paramecium tetraurelia TaxID=5888 RepID=A0D0Y4_PARTE|nr:uncharacterized protein GSPATT00012253001 [Paramecium tetraurelia]CAK76701.1 unnamed protein product [Paramecium tetraurelia]|eukprot:XP_001444098.1 hypothetical protein (macronuclear) [Paramecium tetraurelia strain d4-2]
MANMLEDQQKSTLQVAYNQVITKSKLLRSFSLLDTVTIQPFKKVFQIDNRGNQQECQSIYCQQFHQACLYKINEIYELLESSLQSSIFTLEKIF